MTLWATNKPLWSEALFRAQCVPNRPTNLLRSGALIRGYGFGDRPTNFSDRELLSELIDSLINQDEKHINNLHFIFTVKQHGKFLATTNRNFKRISAAQKIANPQSVLTLNLTKSPLNSHGHGSTLDINFTISGFSGSISLFQFKIEIEHCFVTNVNFEDVSVLFLRKGKYGCLPVSFVCQVALVPEPYLIWRY